MKYANPLQKKLSLNAMDAPCFANGDKYPYGMRAPAVGTHFAPGQSCENRRGYAELIEIFSGFSIWPTGYNPNAQRRTNLDWLVPEYIGYTLLLELIQHGLGTGITVPNHCVGKRR